MADEDDFNDERGNHNDNSDSNDDDQRLINIFLLGLFGWTPNLSKYMRGTESSPFKFIFFCILFLVDLADAIFDLILSVQTIMLGSEGAGNGMGLLLFITTVLGRILSALYGRAMAKHPPDEDDAFALFAFMEMGVFFLEDGAAILVLAKSTGEMTVVETISMWLTMICGVCYIGYIVFHWGKDTLKHGMSDAGLILAGLPAGSAVFQSYILITEVILSNDDDAPLSEGLEIAAFIVYGITAVMIGGLTSLAFSGCLD